MVRRSDAGATLIELMIAMILLVVALLGLAASFPYAMQGVVAAGYQTTATLLAQQAIDNARFTLYDDLPGVATGTDVCGSGSGTYATVSTHPGFSRCLSVQQAIAQGAPTDTTTIVTVVVRFAGIGGMGAGTIWDTTVATLITR
jgi:type II secretory pathway pseudopilin PulG